MNNENFLECLCSCCRLRWVVWSWIQGVWNPKSRYSLPSSSFSSIYSLFRSSTVFALLSFIILFCLPLPYIAGGTSTLITPLRPRNAPKRTHDFPYPPRNTLFFLPTLEITPQTLDALALDTFPHSTRSPLNHTVPPHFSSIWHIASASFPNLHHYFPNKDASISRKLTIPKPPILH